MCSQLGNYCFSSRSKLMSNGKRCHHVAKWAAVSVRLFFVSTCWFYCSLPFLLLDDGCSRLFLVLNCFVFFQAVVMVLESKGDTASHMMIKLLQSFWKTGLITVDQMNRVDAFLAYQFLTEMKLKIDISNENSCVFWHFCPCSSMFSM